MKLLPEFQIEYISAIGKKKRDDKISLYLRADSSSAHRASFPPPPFDNGFLKYMKKQILARLPVFKILGPSLVSAS